MKFFSELKDLLIIDIETVALSPSYDELTEVMQQFWWRKVAHTLDKETVQESYNRRANLLAEFGKVIVIGIGYFHRIDENDFGLRIKALANHDEKALLADFAGLISHKFAKYNRLVAHNGKEFDYPYLCRRMKINGIKIPPILQQLSQRKPWDNPHIDTMEMWRFGDKRNYTSLRLLAQLFGIQPCQDMNIEGSQVHQVYYEETEKGLDRISAYCRCDVRMTAELYLKFRELPAVKPENIIEIS